MILPDIPSDQELALNRAAVIAREQALFLRVKEANPPVLALNLGCGGRLLGGFKNIDKYVDLPGVIKADLYKLDEADNTVDVIFCAHALEHLPIRHARMALVEWARVLKAGGKAYIGIPDLGITMTKLLNPSTDSATREFLLYALFGFQTDPANRGTSLDYPVEPGQFHTCGFTRATLRTALENASFMVEETMSYDGWGTPSVWAVAMRC